MKEKIRELYNQRVSKSDIARRVKVSRPVVIEVCREVDNMKKAVPTERDSQKEGLIAAKAFKLFKRGKKPDEVVIIIKQPPESIMKLYTAWIEMADLSSASFYNFLNSIRKTDCEICREALQPTTIVIGHCRNNHMMFFGDIQQLDRLGADIIYINLRKEKMMKNLGNMSY